jgi:hypothetical protein
MDASRGALEQVLEADLDMLFAGLADDWSSVELYRALSQTRLAKLDGPGGQLSLSADRAHALVNSTRERHGKTPLELPLSGGSGEISSRAAEMLASIGWNAQPGAGRFVRESSVEATTA